MESTLRTFLDLYKHESLAVLCGNNRNSYTTSAQSKSIGAHTHNHINKHIFHNVETVVGLKLQPERQRTLNVTLRGVRATIVAVEKQ